MSAHGPTRGDGHRTGAWQEARYPEPYRRPVSPEPDVVLVPVDDDVLERLVAVATTGAAAAEVTPGPGEVWTPERVAWLRAFHRDRRDGLGGAAREVTWAVVAHGQVVGAVRLARVEEDGVLEAGVWLTRSARGRGVGRAAVEAVVEQAAALGAVTVRAETTAGNEGALGVLRRLGSTCSAPAPGLVRAELALPPGRPGTSGR